MHWGSNYMLKRRDLKEADSGTFDYDLGKEFDSGTFGRCLFEKCYPNHWEKREPKQTTHANIRINLERIGTVRHYTCRKKLS